MATPGFVVAKVDDDGLPTAYWNGTAFDPDINTADFMPTKPQARYVQGSTQAQDTSVDILVKDAESTVVIVP